MAIKGSTLLIAASLAANAALVAVLAVRAPSVFHRGPFDSTRGAQAPATFPAVPLASENGAISARTWPSLNSQDLHSLIGRLRAAGFPPNIVRAIVQAEVDELLSARKRAVMEQMKVHPYWSSHFGNWDQKTLDGFKSLYKERTNMMKDLLGADAEPSSTFYSTFSQSMNGGLAPDKSKRVQAILSDYNDLKNEIFNSSKGSLLPEDYEKLAYLEREQQADMASSLSPGELSEYKLRNSPTAVQLRNDLQAFNPTEDEFRAIFKVQEAFDQQYGPQGMPLSPDQQRERQAHQGDVLPQIQDVLGPDRFAEYKRDTDPDYAAVSRLVERLDLPSTATNQVVALRDDISRRADAIRQDPGLSAADKGSQLATLADEATSKAAGILGERGLAAYKQSNGLWIKGLRPPSN